MRRLAISLLFLLVSLPATAEALKIIHVSPRYGPPGTPVTLVFASIPFCPILPPGPSVTFGTTPATNIIDYGENSLTVVAPDHALGVVDIEVWFCGAEPGRVTNAFTYTAPGEQPFRVVSVTPQLGSIRGGNDVVIKLDQIPFCFDPVPPASVFFDEVEGINPVQDDVAQTITVTTPPHAEGPVDLTVRTCGGASVIVPNGFFFLPEEGLNPKDYEKVLIPVTFNGPGARGSQWRTTVAVTNFGNVAVDVPEPVFGDSLQGCSITRAGIEGQTTSEPCLPDHPSGLMIYPRKRLADDLKFGARISDTSRSDDNAGTEIPIVREREFRYDRIVLVDVPIDARYRTSLRVYNPDQYLGLPVRVRFLHAMDPKIVLAETTIPLTAQQEAGSFPRRPAFLFIDDLAARFPRLAGEGHVQVELIPSPELGRARIWAMASVTNNETQLVTTVTPQ